MNVNPNELPFASFFEHLAQKGFTLTVDHYFKLYTILNQFAKERSLTDLKYLMAPIITTSEKQQHEFYHAYDNWFHAFPFDEQQSEYAPLADESLHPIEPEPIILKSQKRVYVIGGCFAFMVCLLVMIVFYHPTDTPIQEPAKESRPVVLPLEEQPQPSQPIAITNNTYTPIEDGAQQNLNDLSMPEQEDPKTGGQTNWDWLKAYNWAIWRIGLLVFGIVYFLIHLYAYNRQSLALQKVRGKKPPLAYPIQVKRYDPEFVKDRSFYTTARRLKERQKSDVMALDVKQTIKHTIASGGFPKFVYKALTKQPEYLILINLPDYKDHYAHFIKHLSDRFDQEEIVFTRYFYKEDPQICFKEIHSQRAYLTDIIPQFKGSRLIIMGSGDLLLDPLTGEREEWTDQFELFKERVLLTTRSMEDWGIKEVSLSHLFMVLPATLESLDTWMTQFQMDQPIDKPIEPTQDNHLVPFIPDYEDIAYLKTLMADQDTFEWLCACAVYPELHWNLTLYLYRFVSNKPLQESSMLRLIQLPWFRTGNMPDPIRLKLIKALDKDKLTQVRHAILDLLEKNQPASGEQDTYRLNIAIQKWMLNPKDPELKKDIQKIAIDEQRILQDYTLLRMLSSLPSSPLNFIIPKRLRRLFFKNALPLFGFKAGIKLLWATGITFLIMLGVIMPDLMSLYSHYQEQNKPIEHNLVGPSFTNELKMNFVLIKAGTFTMGTYEQEKYDQHQVKLTKNYYMQTTEVTQGQWKSVMGNNPSSYKNCGDNCPVESVSWEEVQDFIGRLNQKNSGYDYRLPTEAEWEYAARAGTTGPFAFGDCLSTNDANYDGNFSLDNCPKGEYREKTIPVASLKPNAWGLYDMHGNVYEWCHDWYGEYSSPLPIDPIGPKTGVDRILRGGGWNSSARYCRSAHQNKHEPDFGSWDLGFRLVASPVQHKKGE